MGSPAYNLCAAAAKDVGDGENVGVVEFIPIIMTLLPMLTSLPCFKRDGADDPKAFLADHYDPNTDQFDSGFVERMRRQTRRAARMEGQGRLSVVKLDDITRATLKHAMLADDADVVSFCKANQ